MSFEQHNISDESLNPHIQEKKTPQVGEKLEGDLNVVQQVDSIINQPQETGDIQAEIKEKLERFKAFAEKNNIQGYDVFEAFINQASSETQRNLLDSNSVKNLTSFIKKNKSFPVNEFEFKSAIIVGNQSDIIESNEVKAEATEVKAEVTEVKAEVTEVKAEVTEVKAEVTEALNMQKMQNLLDIKSTISAPETQHILSGLDSSSIEDIRLVGEGKKDTYNPDTEKNLARVSENLVAYFSQANILEKNILPQAKASGNYEAVKNSLITLGGGENGKGGVFESRILAWELGSQAFDSLPPEQKVKTSAALGTSVNEVDTDTDIEKSGNIFTMNLETGEEINYDVVTGARNISIDGYSIDASSEDTGDYQTPKLEYMRAEQEHLPIIKIIQNIVEAINAKQIDTEDLAEIKATLRKIPGVETLGMDFESMNSGKEIQEKLRQKMQFHQSALEEARKDYKHNLFVLRDAQKVTLEKKDARIKQVLGFFKRIGFTMIPQYITDQVIDTLNSNTALARQLGFDEMIDFKNGKLGMNKNIVGEIDGNLEVEDMKAFADFMNRLLGVTDAEGNPPINIDAIGTMNSPLGEDGARRMQYMIAESGILIGGAGRALKNLQKESKTNTAR